MNVQSILLVLRMVSELAELSKAIGDIAKRVADGEEITQFEIDEARKKVAESVAGWDESAQDSGGAAQQ